MLIRNNFRNLLDSNDRALVAEAARSRWREWRQESKRLSEQTKKGYEVLCGMWTSSTCGGVIWTPVNRRRLAGGKGLNSRVKRDFLSARRANMETRLRTFVANNPKVASFSEENRPTTFRVCLSAPDEYTSGACSVCYTPMWASGSAFINIDIDNC